jgi:medium-chain acyl-[acyl-carrier-protein] hydrolase
MFEPPANSLTEITAALVEALRPYEDAPLALFGHSFGALISFDFGRCLQAMNVRIVHLFVAGRDAPQLPDPEPPIRHLPTEEFVKAVRQRYEGIPDEILHNAEMMQLALPALRADIALNETYRYVEEVPLGFPISCFGGLNDGSTTAEGLAAWRDQTSASFKLKMLPGDHFFIHTARETFLRTLADDLDRSLRRASLKCIA